MVESNRQAPAADVSSVAVRLASYPVQFVKMQLFRYDHRMSVSKQDRNESWDDVPVKVVGRRIKGAVDLKSAEPFLRMSTDRGLSFSGYPKGVFRFRSHEEANEWLVQNRITR